MSAPVLRRRPAAGRRPVTAGAPDVSVGDRRWGPPLLDSLLESLGRLNYKYELLIGHNVMEPWEKVVVNVAVLVCVTFVARMVAASTPLDALGSAVRAVARTLF
ncbi:hypothetical protein H4R18_005015 [Coemansia javaensis]|uniref:Uncharacterized protein n=1 Tax=Coemansia javaensis TaxID=2761396 RepID=A0A9W8LG22_9FUNG|nr:hypothetical protein H4R18_005015 [Coemansia javaensis]